MKKLLILAYMLTLYQHPAFTQSKIDSLRILVKKDKEDTSKINHLNELARELIYSNPDTSLLLSNQALRLAEIQKWEKGIANSLYHVSICHWMQGNNAGALESANKSFAIYEQLKDKKGKLKTLSIIGLVYYNLGDFPNALDHHFKALNIDVELGDKAGTGIDLGNIGNVYAAQGDYPKALDYYFKALKISEELANKNDIAVNLGNIGFLYSSQGDYPKALAYYLKALKIYEELGYKSGIATYTGNIGVVYVNQGDYPKALDYYFRALKIDSELGNKTGIARHLGNIGEIYYTQSNYTRALKYYSDALKIGNDLGDKSLIAYWVGSIGKLYIRTGKFKEAEVQLKKAIALENSIGSIDHTREFEEILSRLYDTTGRYELALLHYKKAMILKDTLFNQEKNKEITRMEMNYEYDKKEAAAKFEQDKKDALAQKELQKEKLVRNGFIGGFAAVLLFAAVVLSQRNKIRKGKKLSDELLLNILPSEVAEELKAKGSAGAKQFDEVTVMFTDFKNFTFISEKLSPAELVSEIDYCFKAFDNIIGNYNIEKIKTIGDSYMCAGGLPVANTTNAYDVVRAALEIQLFISAHFRERMKEGKEPFETRIGIHSGPVVAGIVGVKKFAYDIWGDTVNIASRMESSGEAGKVNISGTTYALVRDQFRCTYRGKIKAKNKGEIDMYFVDNALQSA